MKKTKLLLKLIFSFALLFILFLLLNHKVFATEQEENDKFCYVSDIPYRSDSSVGWGSITLDANLDSSVNNGMIALMVNGEKKQFFKGISAHATSTLIYDITKYNYDYFTSYIGVDAGRGSNGNGVKFAIYTSVDGENWDLKTPASPQVMKGNTNAQFVTIDIKDANYIKLYAHNNGNATADHAVYADAKLIKEGYDPGEVATVDFIKTVEQYDEEIKKFSGQEITVEYEKLLLRRKFVNNVGYDLLQFLATYKASTRDTLKWLMYGDDLVDGTADDVENLRYYLSGGTPLGNYSNSLAQLERLYAKYKNDFSITEPISDAGKKMMTKKNLNWPTTKGNLYKRMVITLSLTHSSRIGLWMQSSQFNESDSVTRYAIYKQMYDNGQFKATDAVDITPWFETYNIEQLRWVLGTLIDDEEVLWLNEYTQTRIDEAPGRVWALLTPHPYMAYVWPNYANPVYYDEANKEYFNDLFAVKKKNEDGTVTKKGLFEYVPYRNDTSNGYVYKLWMNFRNKFGTGAVCGGISKSGHCIRGVNAIPSAVIGQPGHAALLYYNQNAEGKGLWGIDNDVSGWIYSEKGERMPLGWGNDRTYVRGYNVPYVILAQEAMNDYNNLEKAEKLLMAVDTYQDNQAKQEQIYRKAIEAQSINLDAWAGLVKLYVNDPNKTEEQCYQLEKEMMEALKCFPFPMYNLSNYLKTKLTSSEYEFKFTLLQTKILTEAKDYPDEGSTVLQPGLTRGFAAYLLGQIDTSLASFSFDGENAGKIVLSSRFDGNGIRWDYSLDGKNHWKEVASTAEDHTHLLTKKEIGAITAENDIYIHIVGTNYSEENIYQIDIQESAGLPSEVYANDLENKLMAAVPGMEWKLNATDEWTLYSQAEPDLTGDKNLFVRMAATGVHLEGETVEYQFTQDEVNNQRKYIPIAHLEIAGYSTESQDNKRPFYAPNAIDGNANTLWHTDFGQNVLQQPTKPFISIKLDEPKNISALEFIQKKYPGRPQDPDDIKNARVYVGIDGETWIQAGQIENCDTYGNLYAINFEKPVYGQYVKIELDTKNMFASLAMVNLFEDTTVVTLGTFSFDGENAEKIMILDKFKGNNWEYSLDGGATWKTGAGDEQQLSPEELSQINVDHKIKLRLKQSNKESTIDIQAQELPVITAYLNDLENRLIGMGDTSKLEWRTKNSTGDWISYSKQEPIVTGDTKLLIRKKATSTLMASEAVEFTFTEDNQPKTAKYVPIKYITSVNASNTTVPSRGEEAKFAIDGLPTTMWHSNRTTTTMHDPRWIVLELDEPRYISKLEYVRKAGYAYGIPRDGKVLVSMDGENWTEVLDFKNLYNVTTAAELTASDDRKELALTKVEQAKYVKVECTKSCDSVHGDRDGKPMDYFFSCAMINLFEDTTKVEKPTAEIEYSIKETTNQNVTATLVNKSTEITVTNNDGKDSYTFTENGEFTFEFVDKKGTKGTAKAKVDWICKTLPTPTIVYTPNTLTNQDVTATVTFDREGTKIIDENGQIIENGNTHVFTENGKHEFRFKGPYGNIGKATASVDWIDKKAPVPTITYSSTNLSNQDVTATVTFDEENVTVKDGNTHTFTANGEYTFEFADAAGNTGTATANVTWIDKDLPTATITYSTTNLTNQDVTATVTFDREGTKIVDENGTIIENGNTYVFTENGIHEFSYVEPVAGKRGVAVAKVDWIDKVAPVGTIQYSNTNLTNQNVTATITFNEKDVRITNNGGKDTYTFEMNGEFEFEFVDKAGNIGKATAEVGWIDKRQINATITYNINDITNQDVIAYITFDKDNVNILNEVGEVIATVRIGNSYTYTFTEKGTHEFRFIGPAGNTGVAIAEVTWIDKTPPVATITYDNKELTNRDVTATVTFDEGGVTIVDKDGNKLENGRTHVFTENGTHTFYYVDSLGNKGTAVANVDWIDKVAPTAQIEYNTTKPTNKQVIAKLVKASEPITITNNKGKDTYTFTKNGEFKFEFVDKVGNKGSVTAKVDWMDTTVPTAEIEYSTKEQTEGEVIARLVKASEPITITNNNGKDTYTFTKNGQFIFEFIDEAGNKGTAIAKVDWMKDSPEKPENPEDPTDPQDPEKPDNPNDSTKPEKPGESDKPDEYKIGDVNGDGKITATDVLLVKRHLVAAKKQEWILTGLKFKAGDINKNRNITATDLLLIKRLVLSEMKK